MKEIRHFADFLLEKLHSYGEALNLRGAMATWFPIFPLPMVMEALQHGSSTNGQS